MNTFYNGKEITKENLFKQLASHEHYPNSICRHPIPGENLSETVFSIVMNLSSRELHWLEGKPCEHLNEVG